MSSSRAAFSLRNKDSFILSFGYLGYNDVIFRLSIPICKEIFSNFSLENESSSNDSPSLESRRVPVNLDESLPVVVKFKTGEDGDDYDLNFFECLATDYTRYLKDQNFVFSRKFHNLTFSTRGFLQNVLNEACFSPEDNILSRTFIPLKKREIKELISELLKIDNFIKTTFSS